MITSATRCVTLAPLSISNKYYVPLVEIKDFNALIDTKPLFDQRMKNKQEVYKKLVKMSRNYVFTTRNFLDYLYHIINSLV